jgi:hypothetical protein
MSLVDPFDVFGVFDTQGLPTGETEFVPTLGVTGEIRRQSEQGFFGGLFEGAQDFLGFASEGAGFLGQVDAFLEGTLGAGFLPQSISPVDVQPVQSSILPGGTVAGIPVIVLLAGGGLALWLALR